MVFFVGTQFKLTSAMDPHSALHEAGGPRDFPPEQRFSFLSLPSILFPSLPFHFLSFSFLTYLTFPFLPFLPFIPVFSILHSCLSAFLTLDDDIWAKQAKQHENPNVSKAKLPLVHVTNMKKNFAHTTKKERSSKVTSCDQAFHIISQCKPTWCRMGTAQKDDFFRGGTT